MKNLKPKIKTKLRKNKTRKVTIDCSEEKLTDQSYVKACDINCIMANYQKTGVLPHTRENLARYIDNTEIPSLIEAHELIEGAKSMFMELPSHVRKLMDNDPTQLESFIRNPENVETLVKHGLLRKNEASVVSKQDVSPTPPAAAKSQDESKTDE